MKRLIEQLLLEALEKLKQSSFIPQDFDIEIKIDRTKDRGHGDFATNLAMLLAKPCRQSPLQIANLIAKHLPVHESVERIEIAGPGFINFFMRDEALSQVIAEAIQQGEQFGGCDLGKGQKIILEFVSANPTGPLHVGHGRSAAFGASLVNILKAAGYSVQSEYYVNDAGRQMNILALSVWLRYLELTSETIVFPANGYRGNYVRDIAQKLFELHGEKFCHSWSVIEKDLPADEPQGGDKELYIDALIHRTKELLGKQNFKLFHQHALNLVLEDIREDLEEFGVHYDCWFSEQSLHEGGAINNGIQALKDAGHTYENNGALWFNSTKFGDEKDRVLIRANGQTTYFASDVAYHWDKYERGFNRVVDIFGADHHGYVTRVGAAVKALGHDETALKVLLVQFAILYRGSERVSMSTRSGSFVTLRELREEVGNDAARFFYIMRKPEQHMDFDLELAKSESNDNPVYYIQYAHARISSVLRQLLQRGLTWNEQKGLTQVHLLVEPQEVLLISLIGQFPDLIASAALAYEPHQLAYYLRELATALHSYYNAVPLLCDQENLRSARLCLLKAIRQVLRNGLKLIGVSAPESM